MRAVNISQNTAHQIARKESLLSIGMDSIVIPASSKKVVAVWLRFLFLR